MHNPEDITICSYGVGYQTHTGSHIYTGYYLRPNNKNPAIVRVTITKINDIAAWRTQYLTSEKMAQLDKVMKVKK